MPMFRKKPVTIEARQLPPTDAKLSVARITVTDGLAEWCGGEAIDDAVDGVCILIPTMEGTMKAAPGDWIIRGVAGEFYPCKPDIFAATYDPAPDWAHHGYELMQSKSVGDYIDVTIRLKPAVAPDGEGRGTDGWIGASVTYPPLSGESWRRGHDLPDGVATHETLAKILSAAAETLGKAMEVGA